LGHYALAVRIRQQPYDNRRLGTPPPDAPAPPYLFTIHWKMRCET
jgi:hypothetical protein